MIPGLNLPNLPIPLGNGWSLMPPGAQMSTSGGVTVPSNFTLPNLNLSGGLPDLSGLSALAPFLGAAVPQLAPFLPIIGALLNTLHALTTQNNAAIASGAPNQAIQMVHDSAWSQALGAFGQKQIAPPAVG